MDQPQNNLEALRKGLSKSLTDLILLVDKIHAEIEAVSTIEDASQKKSIWKGIVEAKAVCSMLLAAGRIFRAPCVNFLCFSYI